MFNFEDSFPSLNVSWAGVVNNSKKVLKTSGRNVPSNFRDMESEKMGQYRMKCIKSTRLKTAHSPEFKQDIYPK